MMRAIVLGLVLSGCGGAPVVFGPGEDKQEQGLSLCWEGALGMERESRPTIQWVAEQCDTIPDFDGKVAIHVDGCLNFTVYSDGTAVIPWRGELSAGTGYTLALTRMRNYLLHSEWIAPEDLQTAEKLRAVLVSAAL